MMMLRCALVLAVGVCVGICVGVCVCRGLRSRAGRGRGGAGGDSWVGYATAIERLNPRPDGRPSQGMHKMREWSTLLGRRARNSPATARGVGAHGASMRWR
jgi:hypothetical protein